MKKYTLIFITSTIVFSLVYLVNQFTKPDLKNFPTRGLIYINVWEEWCKPCIEELPELHKMNENIIGVKFYLVSDSQEQEKAKELLKSLKIEGLEEIYSDDIVKELSGLFNGQESQVVPKHIIIQDGKVIYKRVGSDAEILKEIEQKLKTSGGLRVEVKEDKEVKKIE